MRRYSVVLMFCFLFSSIHATDLMAQSDSDVTKSVNDLVLVGAFTAGGAVLGLSTLPFYAEPGDHFKNVLFGGAIGVIAGVAWVMIGQATDSRSDYLKTGSSETRTDYQAFLAKAQDQQESQMMAGAQNELRPLWWSGQIFSF